MFVQRLHSDYRVYSIDHLEAISKQTILTNESLHYFIALHNFKGLQGLSKKKKKKRGTAEKKPCVEIASQQSTSIEPNY